MYNNTKMTRLNEADFKANSRYNGDAKSLAAFKPRASEYFQNL